LIWKARQDRDVVITSAQISQALIESDLDFMLRQYLNFRDRSLQPISQGERKKVELCRSFMDRSHLMIWDEPLNYIDLLSREQIEDVILADKPTMLFVEHDRRFIDHVATRVIELPPRGALAPQ
jgi:ATPase subunit of ABC transporter with duplicated ATPase domains